MTDRYRPSLRGTLRNWRDSDLPLLGKLRITATNEWRKIRTVKNCCGHPGEPGC